MLKIQRNAVQVFGWLFWFLVTWAEHETWYTNVGQPFLIVLSVATFLIVMALVFRVVHFAEKLAHALGEPYGTLVLTLSATVIEATILVMVMQHGDQNPTLLRDTVFATIMLVLNGMVGLCLIAGSIRHLQQSFNLQGALSFLHMITPLALLLLILPNYTVSAKGPILSLTQEAFIGTMCVSVYLLFLLLQTGRYRIHFIEPEPHRASRVERAGPKNTSASLRTLLISTLGLLAALVPIVLLSETLGESINYGIEVMGLPIALGGLLVNCLVLTPEFMASFKAATRRQMQRAVNISLGSALATIALTVPLVLLFSALTSHEIIIGLTGAEIPLLFSTLLISIITFISGSANLLQGIVHMMLFFTYLFLIFFP